MAKSRCKWLSCKWFFAANELNLGVHKNWVAADGFSASAHTPIDGPSKKGLFDPFWNYLVQKKLDFDLNNKKVWGQFIVHINFDDIFPIEKNLPT